MHNNQFFYAAIMTLACCAARLCNYFYCFWKCECYVPCYTSSSLFTYFGFSGSHYNSSVGSVNSRLQNVKLQYQYQSFWNWGLFSSSAEVSLFVEFQLHNKGTVLYLLCSLRYINTLPLDGLLIKYPRSRTF